MSRVSKPIPSKASRKTSFKVAPLELLQHFRMLGDSLCKVLHGPTHDVLAYRIYVLRLGPLGEPVPKVPWPKKIDLAEPDRIRVLKGIR